MSRHLLTRAGVLAVASAFAFGLMAVPASANPQATAPYGTFTCSDGRTFDVFGIAVPRFPAQVGFVDGRGIVARWFVSSDRGSLTILDGDYAGDVISFDSHVSGPLNHSRRATPLDLANFTSCTSEGSQDYQSVLTQSDIDILGLEAKYLGASARVVDASSTIVWVSPVQFAHR